MTQHDDVLDYWFGQLDTEGMPAEDRNKLWFAYQPETDEEIRNRFGGAVNSARAGELANWQDNNESLVALIVLLDQFTRNIFRGTPEAFSGDDQALQLAKSAVEAGRDRDMPTIYRVFLYIPYEHSESLEDQQQGVACFDRLLTDIEETASQTVQSKVEGFRQYMVAHQEVIEKFGRFPHRNKILGRRSTEAELTHLERHGGF